MDSPDSLDSLDDNTSPDIPYLPAEEVEDEQLYDHHRIVVDRGQQPLRVDRFLMARIAHASRTKIQLGIEQGFIRVDGTLTKASYKVRPGQVVTVSLPEPPRTDEMLPEAIPLDIVYEDAHLLVVNKPAGMVVHPAHGNWTGTLVNALLYHLDSQLPAGSAPIRPGLVHRIDKDTSGLLVVAKDEVAMMKLARQFFVHSIQRRYQALVWGRPALADGTVDVAIGRSPKDRRVMEAKPDGKEGKRAVTHYSMLEPLHQATLIECRLETGRTHQIRAHMRYIGHPIFGDRTYGGDSVVRGQATGAWKAFVQGCLELCPRQALHARSLGFVHPHTGQELYFEAPLPLDMAQVLERWRRQEG